MFNEMAADRILYHRTELVYRLGLGMDGLA